MGVIKISIDKCLRLDGWHSQASRTGDLISTAGATANDPVTQELVGPGDTVKQIEQILKNMDNLLQEAGLDLDRVMKTLAFVSNIDDFEIFSEAYKKYFPHSPSARSAMQTGKLNHDIVIEIEVTAITAD